MRFPLFRIQAMTNDFLPKLPLLKEWISPQGLREISITFLLVAQLVTERGKETGPYFKAKTYECDHRYCASVLPKLFGIQTAFMPFCVLSALSINSLIWSGSLRKRFWPNLTLEPYILSLPREHPTGQPYPLLKYSSENGWSVIVLQKKQLCQT